MTTRAASILPSQASEISRTAKLTSEPSTGHIEERKVGTTQSAQVSILALGKPGVLCRVADSGREVIKVAEHVPCGNSAEHIALKSKPFASRPLF